MNSPLSITKVTVNLPTKQVEFLKEVAKSESLTVTDVLRRAIHAERFFVEQESLNNKVLIERSADGKIKEIVRQYF